MALFINRDEKRSQYQEKLANDLKGKLKVENIKAEKTESAFLEDYHKTRTAGMVIMVLVVLLVIVAVVAIFFNK